ncbi:hypothetical protein DY000_02002784 [Brassica cretica]|uniref:DNA topoisomerase n=1 Tax=Brassica cretica TaxID=69181 RepID=A0ABQ7CJS9_BRACR|nr:hypothetical protein DY000_02002784 [Brassica cretica]
MRSISSYTFIFLWSTTLLIPSSYFPALLLLVEADDFPPVCFSSSSSEIHEAVQNLREPNQLFAQAVDAREEIDLRIGASFTRFQTMLLKDRFSIDSTGDKERSRVISYGPCQFPTLGFIVERYWEIQAHEPEEFWTVNCSHESEDGLATKAENNNGGVGRYT